MGEDVQQQHQQQQHNNNNNNRCTGQCQGQRQDVPDVIPILVEKMRRFTTIFGDTFRVVSTIFLILFLLSMMPKFIISNVVFMFIARALGLHLPSVVAGNIILDPRKLASSDSDHACYVGLSQDCSAEETSVQMFPKTKSWRPT